MSALNVNVPDTLTFVTLSEKPEHVMPLSACLSPALVTQPTDAVHVPTTFPPQGATTPHMLAPPTLKPTGPLPPPPQPEPRSDTHTETATHATTELFTRRRSCEGQPLSNEMCSN